MKQDTLSFCENMLPTSMKHDTLLVCPKFWKSFKDEVSTKWDLVDKQGRVTKVEEKEYDKDTILIHQGWSEFRRVNEVYNAFQLTKK